MMNQVCPIKQLAASISFSILGTNKVMAEVIAKMSNEDATKATYCDKESCAWWNTTRGCCGVLEKSI